MSGQTHRSDPRILNRRTLGRDHPRLAAILTPGMRVLDVGCGTGAITLGIAEAVGPQGEVLGIDRDAGLLALAPERGNLRFQQLNVLEMETGERFDVVSAARVLQWISDPAAAIARMVRVLKPGGRLVAIDYNHASHRWTPPPPEDFRRFFQAFLDWRAANGWDNQMGDHLPALFREAGLLHVASCDDDEIAGLGADRDADEALMWMQVAESLGGQIGMNLDSGYEDWVRTQLQRQTLELRTVIGTSSG